MGNLKAPDIHIEKGDIGAAFLEIAFAFHSSQLESKFGVLNQRYLVVSSQQFLAWI